MDPQNNPLNNTQGDDVPAGDTTLPSGGSTFQPQDNPAGAGATPPPTPGWQNDAAADAAGVYGAPQPDQASTMPPNPLMAADQPAQTPNPTETMNQDFQQASQMAVPTATPSPAPEPVQPGADASSAMPPNPLMATDQPLSPAPPESTMPTSASSAPTEPAPMAPAPEAPAMPETAAMPQPIAPEPVMTPSAEPLPSNDMGGSPPPDVPGSMPEMPQPIQNEVPMPEQQPAGMPAPRLAPEPTQGGLPGSAQLGAAAAGMDQMAMQNPAMGGNMGSYGPPPKNNKKIIFIIIGAVLGVLIISVVIGVLISTRRQPAQTVDNTQPTNTVQQAQVPTPSSGPAAPPEGYVTIEKQCYTFALIQPNTVPQGDSCTFDRSTFGQKASSIISVDTTTTPYKTIDEFLEVFRQDKSIESEENIKLDNFDAKQVIYKFSDGKTYSFVAALLTGKNYQQDGKSVTGIGITTSYQDSFSKEVTKNVIDTWRFK